ncbi:MAG: hypothetical protein OSJ45_05530 [Lachnospiraceae bacterium]|nr:hypothetical protein [Lachnospiraceae bacterium]
MGKYNFETADFNSELWEQLRGAYGNIQEDIAPLMVDNPEVPEDEKTLNPYMSYKSDYMIAFDNVCNQLWHQMSFYDASYIAMPYLAKAFNYWYEKNDFIMQVLFLINAGIIVSTDNKYNDIYNNIKDTIPENIMESYNQSILFFKEKAEELLTNKLDMLKQFKPDTVSYICISLLAFVGKREHSFILLLENFSQCPVICGNCDFFLEDIDLDNDIEDQEISEELNSLITPAPSVIGRWDRKSLDNTYIWLSNVLHIAGSCHDVKKLSYFYGTFTCPGCGTKSSPVIDVCMKALMEG